MKVIKPQKLSVLTRCFEFERRFHFAASVLLYVPLSDKTDLWSEVGMWKFAAEALGKDAALDTGMPKRTAEFVVHGAAHAPGGTAVPACPVRVKLGEHEKILYVFGDRHWDDTTATMPQPFIRMPITWDRAFGGEGYAANPLGKGAARVEIGGRSVRQLPNIESPHQRVTRHDAQVIPAGFGVIDQMWAQRAQYVGTYDDAWLKTDFPGFAHDLDWRFFNLAPPDQWLDAPLRGDESYELENLHPQHAMLSGKLPGLRARCFLTRRADGAEQFEELPLRLNTLWLFPDAERCILIYQGVCQVAEQEGEDVVHLLAAAEHLSETRPLEHYRDALIRRLDPDTGMLHAMRESELLPSGLAGVDPGLQKDHELTEGRDLMRANLKKKTLREIEKARAVVASHGLDPDEHGPKIPPPEEPLPDLEHLPEYMARVLAQAGAQREQHEAEAAQKMDMAAALFASQGRDFDEIRRERSERPAGPPKFSAQEQLDRMSGLALMLKSHSIPTDEIDGYLADPAFRNRFIDGERKLKQAYVLSAHLQDAAPVMPPAQAAQVREQVITAHRGGRSLAGLDLTGADLSGLVLSGANFEGSLLESANFEDADLSGCSFRNAVLTRGRMARASFKGSCCIGANLGAIECDVTTFEGADLTDAILRKAVLRRAQFQGARLVRADCAEAVFDATDWSGVVAPDLTLIETNLSGLMLKGAQLARAIFINCKLASADFSGTVLEQATFLGTTGLHTLFRGADLRNARFVSECDFSGADFTNAAAREANLRGTRLTRAIFIHANLDGADLSDCDLAGAHFYQAEARQARLVKADLQHAVFVSANLLGATLQRSNVLHADFRNANLFGVDFARVKIDRTVQFAGALMKRTRTYPRLSA